LSSTVGLVLLQSFVFINQDPAALLYHFCDQTIVNCLLYGASADTRQPGKLGLSD
jgi:hypothetical protein